MATQIPFGDFVLDLDTRVLRRGGETLKLSPKAFQLLEIIATNRPKAFSKAELQERLWPGTFVVEKNLANLVAEIRDTLGDTPLEQRFIRTVPRFGYAFRELPPDNAAIRLAVLPVENLTGAAEQDYLCDGMTEELIAQLGAVDPAALKVIARTSAMHYRNTTKRIDEIGRELDVRYLLETSLRRVGNRVRVTVQLVSTQTQDHIWSEQYELQVIDPLALQSQVADTVVSRTIGSLGIRVKTAAAERPPGNAAAYEHYVRGRHHLRKETKEGFEKARAHFHSAIALDPRYARAHSGLAEAYLALGEYALLPIAESHPLAREAALAALRFESSLAEAHRTLAAINGQHYWLWAEAEDSFQRALRLAPNDVTTLRMYSFFLAYTGRPGHGLPIAALASSLDPVSVYARLNLGVVLYIAGLADEAVLRLEETLELDENFAFARMMLGLVYVSKGMLDPAVAQVTRARELAGNRPDIVAVHGFTLGRSGRRREALATLDDIKSLTNPQTPPPFQIALVHVGLEDWDRAFEWLEKAVDARAWEVPLVKADPVFDRLRLDPRFSRLVARLRLPE